MDGDGRTVVFLDVKQAALKEPRNHCVHKCLAVPRSPGRPLGYCRVMEVVRVSEKKSDLRASCAGRGEIQC